DHGKLLASSGYYRKAMADRRNPNAFAQSLTGVYATDPSYGTKLVSLMQQYNLYRYDAAPPASRPSAQPSAAQPSPAQPSAAQPSAASPVTATIPGLPVSAPTT